MATFGNTEVTATSAYSITSRIAGTKFQMGAIAGTGDSITAILLQNTGSDKLVKCALYDSDKNLVTNGVTNEETVSHSTSLQIITFNFATPPNLTADAYYWIVAWANGGALGYNDQVGYDWEKENKTYNGFPATHAMGVFVADDWATIYCTYTEAVAVPIVKRRRGRMSYGLKPARIVRPGRIGV